MGHSLIFKHIPSDDINITPFQVFKNWTINHNDYTSSFGVKIKRAILDSDYKIYNYPKEFQPNVVNLEGTDQKSLWYNINGFYYKEEKSNLDIEYSNYMFRTLHSTASYIQIPQQIFGEGIKLRSLKITNGTVNLEDDGLGNIIDKDLVTGSMVSSDYLLGYWGFNDKFKYRSISKIKKGLVYEIKNRDNLSFKNISFKPGIKSTGTTIKRTGLLAEMDGNGTIWLDNADNFNFKNNQDFAISLWTELPTSQSRVTGSYNYLVSKEGDVKQPFVNKNSEKLEDFYVKYSGVKYPYAIKIYNQSTTDNGKVVISRSDIYNTPTITSSVKINDNEQHHILLNKTGSTLELWVDGCKEGDIHDTTKENTYNKAILTFGSNGYDNNTGLSGSLDEIRFYSKGLEKKEIKSLADMDYVTGSAYNTAVVGNVFYPQGTIVISDCRPKYQNIMLGNNFDYTSSSDDNFTLKYKSTLTLYENEILCRVSPGEFNFTTNPTIRQHNDINSEYVKPFATASFNPYVSSIGLYDSYGRLLAVGKTAQAIPIKEDVETTFIVKFDE